MYVWQSRQWPRWRVDDGAIQPALAAARLAQGLMLGMAQTLHLTERGQQGLEAWTSEALATALIEGENLELHSVRASAARRLGLADHPSPHRRQARAEATLDVIESATLQPEQPVTAEMLCAWQAALFPTGRSGWRAIATGRWREHADPMKIVTPRLGKPDVVHYEAPPSALVPQEMARLLAWFNDPASTDGLVRAAIAHAWFEAIHPFEDGNGRIGRALAERAVVHDQPASARLFSLSQALWLHRKEYYAELETLTRSSQLDTTRWVTWFLGRLRDAFEESLSRMRAAVERQRFHHDIQSRHPGLSRSQRKALDRLFEAGPAEFQAGLSTRAYVSLTGVSRATAYRELSALADCGLLEITGQGRATGYRLRSR